MKSTNERPGGPDWHREGVGGMWDEIGTLQIQFLCEQGLQPYHYLLDVGCGALRGGVRFIDYLEPDHYFGIDKQPELLEAGKEIELVKYGLVPKAPCLYLTDDFDLSCIPDQQFDYAIAQSVFTHLTPEMIELCLARVMPRLTSGGRFYASFFDSGDESIELGEAHPWRQNELSDPRYPVKLFRSIASRLGIKVDLLGDWNHPRDQQMLLFTNVS